MTKRRLCGWIAVLALFLNSAVNSVLPVMAADTVHDETDATFIDNEVKLAEVVSAYGLSEDNTLYALLSPSEDYKDYDFSKSTVSLQSNAATAEKLGTMKPISECFSTNIHYMFLIDNSGSISEQRDIIKSYVDAIESAESHEAYYTVSTFDQKFKVVKERMTDVKEVKKTVDNLKYDGAWTDPYTGVNEAIKYLGDYARTSGDVIVLILITDGKVELKGGKEADLAAETGENIKNSPEVILSTICTGSWTGKSKDTFTVGRGPHNNVSSSNAAKNAGSDMVSFLEGLYCTGFKLKQAPANKFSITLNISNVFDSEGNEQTFLPKDYPSIGNVSMLDARVGDSEKFAEEAEGKDPEGKPADDPDGTRPTEGTLIPTDGDTPSEGGETPADGGDAPAETEPAGDEEPADEPDGDDPDAKEPDGQGSGDEGDTTGDEDGDEAAVSDNEAVSDNAAVSDNNADDTEDDADGEKELPGWVLPVSIAGGVLLLIILLLAIVLLIVVINKNKKKKRPRPKSAPAQNSASDSSAEPVGRTVAASQDAIARTVAVTSDEIPPTVAATPDPISRTVAATPDPIPKTAGARIPVSIDVYSGSYEGPVSFELTDLTTIGSGSGCDIRFAAEDMTAVAAQLIVREGHVYLVDEGTDSLVAVGGIRIQGQNVLRSGDVISVGEAEFTLRF